MSAGSREPIETIETIETDLGPIELARRGSGPPVLFVHGTPGGSDSSLAMGRFLVDAGFTLLAPSRPGYLGTPLARRESIDSQADLLSALLDELGHGRAGVLAWSGGGPSSYRLAVRDPVRVAALVGFAAVSGPYEPPPADTESRLMLDTRPGNFILREMAAHAPKSTISATLDAEGDLTRDELESLTSEVFDDPDKRQVVLTMAEVVADRSHRKAGVDNDLARFAEIDRLGLERIAAPSLIIHGDADTDVEPRHGERAASEIPGAKHLVIKRGTHLALFVNPLARAFQEDVVALMRQALSPS